MERGVTVGQIRESIRLCRERGIQTGMFLMWGYEGEVTMEELLRALRAGGREALEKVDGISFLLADGSLARTRPRALIPDLDALPWPDRESVDIEHYVQVWREHHGMGSVSVITARGCPYHCRWCSHATYGNTHRRRSARAVADEVEWILDRYRPDMLWMADDVFTIHPAWLLQYARELKKRGLITPFECITRADRLNTRIADTLAEMQCFRVFGKRVSENPGRNGAGRHRRPDPRVDPAVQRTRNPNGHVPHVGLRRGRACRH